MSAAEAVEATVVNQPPAAGREIVAFPQRDFVSASGYAASEGPFTVQVLRNGATVSTADGVTLNSEGLVEVNHPGGGCWEGVTPDLRPGDQVRVTNRAGVADQATVANVTAQRPVITVNADGSLRVTVRGTAQGADGAQIPLAQIEQRLINADLFATNRNRRTLRAPGDGTIRYDTATSMTWTATYPAVLAADREEIEAAESRVLWLSDTPLAATQLTIFESGDGVVGGPQDPCSAQAEPFGAPPAAGDITAPDKPGTPEATVHRFDDVQLTWTPSTDVGVTGYRVYRNDVQVALVDGSTTTYRDIDVPTGSWSYTVDAFDAVHNVSEPSAVSPVVQTEPAPPLPEPTTVTSPPTAGHSVVVFPERDFVSMDGFSCAASSISDCIAVQVVRAGTVVSESAYLTPDAGFVEVNHPGGGCWARVTPDIRPGDVVRVLTLTEDVPGDPRSTRVLTAEAATVADVTAGRPLQVAPGVVRVQGTARTAAGAPIPEAQLEQRLINPDLFDDGRRVLSTPSRGTLTYDAPGSTSWTATYTGLSQADVDKALAAEARIMWLSETPLAATQLTIYEVGSLGGPQAPCTAPSETVFAAASPSGGTYAGPQSVSLFATRPIPLHYTLDGSTPTGASPVYTGPVAVGPGTTTLKFLATDGALTSSVVTEQYVVDVTAPAAPSAPDLDAASDTGRSSTDDITRSTTPTFTGTADPGTWVRIEVDGVERGSAVSADDGTYRVPTSGVSAGSHQVTAESYDLAGNSAAAATGLQLTVDTTAATMGVSSGPTNPTNDVLPVFTFTSSEPTDVRCSLSTGADAYQPCSGPGSSHSPAAPLAAGTWTFLVRGTDVAGNVGTSAPYRFTLDTTAPTVVERSPAPGGKSVALAANITARFSEAVGNVSGTTFTLTSAAGTGVTATVTYSAATRVATLDPASSLLPDTVYTARLTSGIMDTARNALAELAWSFTTGPAPTVTGRSPAPGAQKIDARANVTATFSEAIRGWDATPATFTLTARGATAPVAAVVSYDAGTRRLTLDPTATLAAGTEYTARLVGGAAAIRDLVDNPLVTTSWTFKTS